jgi:hypothetical protein
MRSSVFTPLLSDPTVVIEVRLQVCLETLERFHKQLPRVALLALELSDTLLE